MIGERTGENVGQKTGSRGRSIVIASGVSGGNAALGWSAPDLNDGSTLTISTDGTNNFGANGPTLLHRDTMSSYNDGDAVSTTSPGRVTISAQGAGMPIVEADAALPYGMGMKMGYEQGGPSFCSSGDGATFRYMLMLDTQVENQIFEHFYLHYPSDHQDNVVADNIRATCTQWQIKTTWHYRTSLGYETNQYSDFIVRSPGAVGGGSVYDECCRIAGNSGRLEYHPFQSSWVDPSTASRWRSGALINHSWVKHNATPGTYTDSDGYIAIFDPDDATPLVDEKTYSGLDWVQADELGGFDYHTLPGWLRGYNIPNDYHVLLGDYYLTTGDGAAARISITDNATYNSSTKMTILTVNSWSATEVQATIVKGIFWQESLVGKHLWLHDATNTPLYVGQL